jgi:hypothetical protein
LQVSGPEVIAPVLAGAADELARRDEPQPRDLVGRVGAAHDEARVLEPHVGGKLRHHRHRAKKAGAEKA